MKDPNPKLMKMFEAQDIIRRLWADEIDRGVELELFELSIMMTKIINMMGEI